MSLTHTPSKIVPTVGRNIHVYPELRRRTERPWHGNVADVHFTDGDKNLVYPLVTVGGLTNVGQPVAFERIPVLDLAPNEPWPEYAFATWMPFQKGQASKTDELTPRLNAVIDLLNRMMQGEPPCVRDFEALGLPLPDFLKQFAEASPHFEEVKVDAALSQFAEAGLTGIQSGAATACAGGLGASAAGPDAASADDGAAAAGAGSTHSQDLAAALDQDSAGAGQADSSVSDSEPA